MPKSAARRSFPRARTLKRPKLAELAALDEAGFRALFAGGPIKRIGHARFLRNVMIAIGNSGDRGLVDVAREKISASEPIVRGAAVWALARLAPDEASALAAGALAREGDQTVREEWEAAVAEVGDPSALG